MRVESQANIDARTGNRISFSTRKLPQGQADSLVSRIYRRIVEDCGGIENYIMSMNEPRTTLIPELIAYSTNRTMFIIEKSVCGETQSQLAALRSRLPE